MTFQKVWEADMKGNGILPLIRGLSEDQKNPDQGYVIVDMNPTPDESPKLGSEKNEITVFKEVHIPENKKQSYNLFIKLHDNYNWEVGKNDPSSLEEQAEINEFLQFAIGTEPLRIARDFAQSNGHLSARSSDQQWMDMLKSLWFKQFRGNSTSYFEHVFLGEQGSKRKKLGGHHFWYHYLINDGPYVELQKEDSIVFIKHVEVNKIETSRMAEVITIRYSLEEKDNHGNRKKLMKDIGGFFVGTSAEGLMALGTVAFLDGRKHIPVELNGEKLDIAMFKDGENARTFYPMIKEAVAVR